MSVRVYRGGYANFRRRRYPAILTWITTLLAIATQMIYPLMPDDRLLSLTFFIVAAFALAGLMQAWSAHGTKYAATWLIATTLFGFVVEQIGVHTAWPFGEYSYSDSLGLAIAGVPLIVPLAWAMISHPILILARRISARWAPLVFGWTIMAWDLFLDPQMVGEGYWTWNAVNWTLPGIDGIPLQNFLGWLLTACVLMYLLDRLPRKAAKDGVPTLMLSWVYASNVLAALVFFGEPAVALWGGLCMGAVVIPWWWRAWSQPQW